jgi:hypothetical protein
MSAATQNPNRRLTKAVLAHSLHLAGRSVDDIARALETTPQFVANVIKAKEVRSCSMCGDPTEGTAVYCSDKCRQAESDALAYMERLEGLGEVFQTLAHYAGGANDGGRRARKTLDDLLWGLGELKEQAIRERRKEAEKQPLRPEDPA